ncbi:MAG: S8 family serine peptidase [Clostridium sp.]
MRVVNISSTVSVKQKYTESAVNAACEQLWKAGVVVVVSAGNLGGQVDSTSYAPANDPFVITVGAVDDNGTKNINDDFMKPWSSSGPTLDNVMKPDIVAPGAHITSYIPAGALRNSAPQNIVDNAYFKMGGTSMAAPVVSGVVALMLQVNPTWTPDQVKWVLKNTATPYLNQVNGTPGIVDADFASYYKNPQSANQGVALSPLLDAGTGTISYNNMSWANMSWANSLDK